MVCSKLRLKRFGKYKEFVEVGGLDVVSLFFFYYILMVLLGIFMVS